MLENAFREQVLVYAKEADIADGLWKKIVRKYSDSSRYYHNLQHLENMYSLLVPLKNELEDLSVITFSIAYHDFIYKIYRKDNEEKSAEAAGKHLQTAGVPDLKINLCRRQILATKKHEVSPDQDTNYFIDADLAILGTDEATYLSYCLNIRKEYKIFPDLIYNPGRKKFLTGLLQQGSIFKTKYFKEAFENNARKNIAAELKTLD